MFFKRFFLLSQRFVIFKKMFINVYSLLRH